MSMLRTRRGLLERSLKCLLVSIKSEASLVHQYWGRGLLLFTRRKWKGGFWFCFGFWFLVFGFWFLVFLALVTGGSHEPKLVA